MKIDGRVIDLLTQKPIAGATLVTPSQATRSDEAGRFVLTGAKTQTWIEVMAPVAHHEARDARAEAGLDLQRWRRLCDRLTRRVEVRRGVRLGVDERPGDRPGEGQERNGDEDQAARHDPCLTQVSA